MTLSDIHRHLAELETAPTRSLGQNFLHDQNLAKWIVGQLEVEPGDHIVEVGPGLGALTEYLSELGVRLTLIEKDGRLVPYLRKRFESARVQVHHIDALDFDLRTLWGSGPVKLIGNLPYYVSTPLIAKFTAFVSPVTRLVLTLQLELARRLGAQPRTKDYGAMTVCVNRRWKTSFLRKMPASVFYPAPKVDSAVVRMDKKPRELVPPLDDVVFESLVRGGFSERRKQLRKLLPEMKPSWSAVAEAMGVEETVRAEELSLAKWEHLATLTAPASAQSGSEIFDVVDEDDRVIGSQPRDDVHANGLRHRAVHMLLQNQAGEIYLQKRSIWKDKNPGRWDSSAAGHVDSGETYVEAAHRELREELGIDVPELTAIGRLSPRLENGWEFIEIFIGRYEGPFVLAGIEVEIGGFFTIEQVRAWTEGSPADFSPVFLQCLPYYLRAMTA